MNKGVWDLGMSQSPEENCLEAQKEQKVGPASRQNLKLYV
jgi:hypothetical protein